MGCAEKCRGKGKNPPKKNLHGGVSDATNKRCLMYIIYIYICNAHIAYVYMDILICDMLLYECHLHVFRKTV